MIMGIRDRIGDRIANISPRREPSPLPDDIPYAGWLHVSPDATGNRPPITHDDRNYGRTHGQRASAPVHLLVSGETGRGKTRAVLGINILAWGPRPVVAMSSKGDMAELTIRGRATHGPVYLMDLSGEVRESELRGVEVTKVAADPVASITTDDEALDMASLLMEVGALGSGDGASSGDSFWQSLARRRLACFLRAGGWYPGENGTPVWGGGIEWALEACENAGPPGPGVGVTSDGIDPEATPEPPDFTEPSWDIAYRRACRQGSRHAASLLAAKAMDQRQRDSIGINCQVALSAWAQESVANGLPAFTPDMLTDPGATLYIVSPMGGAAAPAASLTLVSIVNYWRRRVGQLPPVLFVLDEVTNGSPIPAKRFLGWVGEGRSLGIRLVAAVQSTDQFGLIWNDAALRALRSIMPAVLVMKGGNEIELFERAAKLALPEETGAASLDAGGRVSHSRQRAPGIEVADLVPRTAAEGRLLLSGEQGVRVDLPDISRLGLV